MIAATGWDFYRDIWRPAAFVVSDMERAGFRLDVPRCHRGAEETSALLVPLVEKLNNWAGQDIKWTSHKELAQFLYGTEARAATKKGKVIEPKGFEVPPIAGSMSAVRMVQDGETPCSAASIEYLSDHVPDIEDRRALRVLREFSVETKNLQFWKALPTFVDSKGRIHCRLGAMAASGRLTSSSPNLQNIPIRTVTGKLIREAFISDDGCVLVVADYSGLEWRILGHCIAAMFGDFSIIDEINQGIDPHSATAVGMGLCPGPVELVKKLYPEERGSGKTLNYGINYGKTDVGVGVAIRDKDGEPIGTQRGGEYLERFAVARPGVIRFHEKMVQLAQRFDPPRVHSLLGRPRNIYKPLKRYDKRKRKEVLAGGGRQVLNIIQDCAVDIVSLAMIKVHPNLHPELARWDSPARRELNRMGDVQLLQIHDELVHGVPEKHGDKAQEIITEEMANALEGVKKFLCPLEATGATGLNWGCKS